jgi:hypothetical protein
MLIDQAASRIPDGIDPDPFADHGGVLELQDLYQISGPEVMLVGKKIPFRKISDFERQAIERTLQQEFRTEDLQVGRDLVIVLVKVLDVEDLFGLILFPELKQDRRFVNRWRVAEIKVGSEPCQEHDDQHPWQALPTDIQEKAELELPGEIRDPLLIKFEFVLPSRRSLGHKRSWGQLLKPTTVE